MDIQTIAHYRIIGKLGEGGMGAVYRATDTKLARDVAIKVLPDVFAHDADRLARFTREAQVLASLNHPNIAAVYGIEERAIVMELVEGPTLADRLEAGAVAVEEALRIASQIAEALEVAHERNVVHRDLKPANIKVTPEGKVKVLDFGLAKLTDPREANENPSAAATVVKGHSPTMAGMILGTAAYMSPEQARGKAVDKRADIWAYGVVLYEMLTGKQLFGGGETVTDTLASVVKDAPDLNALPAGTPPHVRRLLDRCLRKDVHTRLRDIGEARIALTEGASVTQPAPVATIAGPRGISRWWAVAMAAVFALAAAGLAFVHFRETPPEIRVLSATLLPPENAEFDFTRPHAMPAISPDGTRIVFGAKLKDGKTQLWLRRLDSLNAQPLPGTEGAATPFWSPDSRWVGFGQENKLRKIDIQGGPPVTIADLPAPLRGGTWSRDGVILFGVASLTPVMRVAAAGGTQAPVTEGNGIHPWFLPDQRHFLYLEGAVRFSGSGGRVGGESGERGREDDFKILVGTIDQPKMPAKVVAQANSLAVYAQGHLLYLRESTLMAQPFDANRLETKGDAVPVVEGVPTFTAFSRIPGFAVSPAGLLVYQTGASQLQSRLVWKDRQGKLLDTLGQSIGVVAGIALSPDGKRVAASITDRSNNEDIWIYDVARGIPTRFTFDPKSDRNPVWSRDGNTLYFDSNRKGAFDLYRKASNGSGAEELLFADSQVKHASDISPGGELLYSRTAEKTVLDLWLLPLTQSSGEKPVPRILLQTPFSEGRPEFSPDAKWVVYQSNESGTLEVYAMPVPSPGGKRQISSGGGLNPRWRRDGKEIYYSTPVGQLMSVEVAVRNGTLEVGKVQKLFDGIVTRGMTYDVTAAGERFLVIDDGLDTASTRPLMLLQNWTATLKK